MIDKSYALHVRWAMRYIAIVRDTQKQFVGNLPAMEIGDAMNDALERLAETNTAYATALEIEAELNRHGFKLTKMDK
jgi:hypothetical protein